MFLAIREIKKKRKLRYNLILSSRRLNQVVFDFHFKCPGTWAGDS